jgi:hypothetical protein
LWSGFSCLADILVAVGYKETESSSNDRILTQILHVFGLKKL